MPRKPTGSLTQTDAGFSLRLRVGDVERASIAIHTADASVAAERAKGLANVCKLLRLAHVPPAKIAEQLRALAASDGGHIAGVAKVLSEHTHSIVKNAAPHKTTFGELATSWTSGELHRQHPDRVRTRVDMKVPASRLRQYILPHLGSMDVEDIALEHSDAVMSALPTHLRHGTRRQIAGIITLLLRIAAYPLRIIASNPLPPSWRPRVRDKLSRPFLRPSELEALLGCTAVPMIRRLLYAFLCTEGVRVGEALSLQWDDLDSIIGSVSVGKAKTDAGRSWKLAEGTALALRIWREIGDTPRPFSGVHKNLSGKFRRDLRLAGCIRKALFDRSDGFAPIRVHDLRHSACTIMAAHGRSERYICQRTGHASSSMLSLYAHQIRLAEELSLGDWPNVAESIPEMVNHLPGKNQEEPSSLSHAGELPSTATGQSVRVGLRESAISASRMMETSTLQDESHSRPDANARTNGFSTGATARTETLLAAIRLATDVGDFATVATLAHLLSDADITRNRI